MKSKKSIHRGLEENSGCQGLVEGSGKEEMLVKATRVQSDGRLKTWRALYSIITIISNDVLYP